jgi:hypothetical protein
VRRLQLAGIVAVVAALAVVGVAVAGGGERNLREQLSGYEEVPAISTTGSGDFRAQIERFDDEIHYRLSYRDLESAVTQSHIHLGQEAVNGGISVFLCSNLGNGPEGTQACPASPATISGTIGPEDVIGPTGQGIELGAYDELLAAIEAEATYVNVHTTGRPGGEIRAQLDGDGRGRD